MKEVLSVKRVLVFSLAAVLVLSSVAFAGYHYFYNFSLYAPDKWKNERSDNSHIELYDINYPATGRINVYVRQNKYATLRELAEYLCYDYYKGSNLTSHEYYYDFVYTDENDLIWNARVFDYKTEGSFPLDIYCLISYTEYVSYDDFNAVFESVIYRSGGTGGTGGGGGGGCNYGAFSLCAVLLGFTFFKKR